MKNLCRGSLPDNDGAALKVLYLSRHMIWRRCCLGLVLMLCVSSCALRSVYIPVSHSVPLFDSTPELRSNLYPGANHVELQVALHPVKHLSFASNINFGSGITVYDAAVGYSGWRGRWRSECFAGFGYTTNQLYPGSSDVSIFSPKDVDYEVRALYQRYYLQPAMGFIGKMDMYRIHYSFALSARLSALHFNDYIYRTIDKALTIDPAHPVYIVDKAYRDKMLYTLEPCITNRVAYGHIYGILQAQAMIPYSEDIDVRHTKFSPGVLLSIGVGYEVPLVKKKVTWAE